MVMTLFELIDKPLLERGLRKGRAEERAAQLEGVLGLIRKEMRRLGIAERRYVKDLRNLGTARKAAASLIALGRAKDPAVYLRRRFGH